MPIKGYFGGHGEEVMRSMRKAHSGASSKRVKSEFYATANKMGMKPMEHMPAGAKQSPAGDIGAHRGAEGNTVFPKLRPGRTGSCAKPLTYRKPASANDSGGSSGGHA